MHSKKFKEKKVLTESDIDWWILLYSTDSNPCRRERERKIENIRLHASKDSIVINDGTYGNQGSGYQISEMMVYWPKRRQYSNHSAENAFVTVEKVSGGYGSIRSAVRHNDLYELSTRNVSAKVLIAMGNERLLNHNAWRNGY